LISRLLFKDTLAKNMNRPVQLAVCSSTEYNSKRLEGLKHPSVADW